MKKLLKLIRKSIKKPLKHAFNTKITILLIIHMFNCVLWSMKIKLKKRTSKQRINKIKIDESNLKMVSEGGIFGIVNGYYLAFVYTSITILYKFDL